MTPQIIAPVENSLGEGPLWHPEREEIFWVDINGRDLFACDWEGGNARRWTFGEAVSALAWVDRDTLLAAGESGLWRFSIPTADAEKIWDLNPDAPDLRSNDGRADRHGNFWIGTMSWKHVEKAGAIYRVTADGPRLYRDGITVSNAICFSPDGRTAYWTDTHENVIMRQPLGTDGEPEGEAEPWARPDKGFADGAVCDAEGHVWNAQWDGWRVARYRPDGTVERIVETPMARPTCPAFGGPGLTRMFVTSARTGLSAEALRAQPAAGALIAFDVDVPGQPEGRFVHLDGR